MNERLDKIADKVAARGKKAAEGWAVYLSKGGKMTDALMTTRVLVFNESLDSFVSTLRGRNAEASNLLHPVAFVSNIKAMTVKTERDSLKLTFQCRVEWKPSFDEDEAIEVLKTIPGIDKVEKI